MFDDITATHGPPRAIMMPTRRVRLGDAIQRAVGAARLPPNGDARARKAYARCKVRESAAPQTHRRPFARFCFCVRISNERYSFPAQREAGGRFLPRRSTAECHACWIGMRVNRLAGMQSSLHIYLFIYIITTTLRDIYSASAEKLAVIFTGGRRLSLRRDDCDLC